MLINKIRDYPTKYKEGFTREEIDDLLKILNIPREKFSHVVGINTGLIIDNELITYKEDIELAIKCISQNRKQTLLEWD